MSRERVRSGTEWEAEVGYSRAIRVGDRVLVSGTTATGPDADAGGGAGSGRVPRQSGTVSDDIKIVGAEDPYKQARQAMENVVQALESAGAAVEDVVRTRMYVRDIESWDEIGRAHREIFGEAAPASTMVEVSRLVDERMVVEVEAEAIVQSG